MTYYANLLQSNYLLRKYLDNSIQHQLFYYESKICTMNLHIMLTVNYSTCSAYEFETFVINNMYM